jgi:hypothetical protein
MNTLGKLWHAIENLASSLNGLASTVQAVSVEVQQRTGVSGDGAVPLRIDGAAEVEPNAWASGQDTEVASVGAGAHCSHNYYSSTFGAGTSS